MKTRQNVYIRIFAILLLSIFPYICSIAQKLPPVFDDNRQKTARDFSLTKTYLPPTKIIWQKAEGEALIKDVQNLTNKGNGQGDLMNQNMCVLKSGMNDRPSIILDYGKELHGGLQIITGMSPAVKPIKVRVRLGESVSEVMHDPGEKGATNDHAIRDFELNIPWLGVMEIGNSGFRFARIDLLEENCELHLKEINAMFIYKDIPYLGSFNCSDTLLNKIWMTGAYTVHLNMQDYLWDGIKRDRLVWLGDMHPEVSTINTVFGYDEVVPKSLDLTRDITPPDRWMNGISSYSLWWIIIHQDWYMHNGDLDYLKEQKDYLLPLLNNIMKYIDDKGKENLPNRFLDWPSSPDTLAIHNGLQALVVWSLDAGENICRFIGEKQMADRCKKEAAKMRKYIPQLNDSKQAAALLSLAGLIQPDQANNIISKDGVQRFSTFYGYYMLQALAQAGKHQDAIDSIRKYWGGMLDMGATSFWEDFNIEWLNSNPIRIDELPVTGRKDIHSDFGDYCYKGLRHSLCHGWASGPTAWMSEHILGVKIIEAGCKTIKIEPNLGNLDFAEGTYPTPYGVLKISHKKQKDGSIKTDLEVPDGIKIIK